MNIAILSNPQSGYNRRKGIGTLSVLAARADITHVDATTPEEMLAALQVLSKQEPEILVINGGDGSVDMVISLMRTQNIFKKEPALALLQGGTSNLIHRDVGLIGRPRRALQKILKTEMKIIERRPLEVCRIGHKAELLYGFLLGTGAIPRVILKTRENLHSRGFTGPLSEVFMLGKILLCLQFKRNLHADTLLKPAAVVCNARRHNQIFTALTSLQKLLPGIASPASNDGAGIIYMNDDRKLKRKNVERVMFELTEPWVLDGEIYSPAEIEINLGEPVRFCGDMRELVDLIAKETEQDVSTAVQTLNAAIQSRGIVNAILFYGSCLWKDAGEDTVYDFYVLVERLRDFNPRAMPVILGSVLPPNVYYMEAQDGDRVVRCKFAVIRLDQFARAAKGKVFTPQIWARFAQPCRIVYSRDQDMAQSINEMLAECVLSFHYKALPLSSEDSSLREIWLRGLRETYRAELRSEKPERIVQIFEANEEAFTKRSLLAMELLPDVKRGSKVAYILSALKRPLQKLVVFLRLMKATLTFENGVDYALWKIERQSGIRIEASNFQRRYPLIGAWPLVWALWRKGAFR